MDKVLDYFFEPRKISKWWSMFPISAMENSNGEKLTNFVENICAFMFATFEKLIENVQSSTKRLLSGACSIFDPHYYRPL